MNQEEKRGELSRGRKVSLKIGEEVDSGIWGGGRGRK